MIEGAISSVVAQKGVVGELPQLKNVTDIKKEIGAPKLGGVSELGKAAPSFSEVLKVAVDEADKAQKVYEHAMSKVAKGESTSIHEVMMRQEGAKLSFLLMTETRNKLVDGYNELLKMSV